MCISQKGELIGLIVILRLCYLIFNLVMIDYFWCMMVYLLVIDFFNLIVFDEDDIQRYYFRGNLIKDTEEWMEKIKNVRLVEYVFGYVW